MVSTCLQQIVEQHGLHSTTSCVLCVALGCPLSVLTATHSYVPWSEKSTLVKTNSCPKLSLCTLPAPSTSGVSTLRHVTRGVGLTINIAISIVTSSPNNANNHSFTTRLTFLPYRSGYVSNVTTQSSMNQLQHHFSTRLRGCLPIY